MTEADLVEIRYRTIAYQIRKYPELENEWQFSELNVWCYVIRLY